MENMTIEKALNILSGNEIATSYEEVQDALSVAERNGYYDLAQQFRKSQENHDEIDVGNNVNDDVSSIAAKYEYHNFIESDDNSDIATIVDQTDILDGKQALAEDKKHEYLNLMFQSAKLEAESSLSASEDFAKQSTSGKIKLFKEAVKDVFFINFSRVAISSQLDTPTSKESKIGSDEYKQYINRQYEKAQKVFTNILNGGKKITLKVDGILSSVADSAIKVENHIRAFKNKATEKLAQASKDSIAAGKEKWAKLADSLQLKKQSLENKAKQISDNRYEIIKNVKNSVKDNSWKIGVNLAANVAMGLGMSAAVAAGSTVAAPLMAYGAYHAASSWFWPVVKEYRKINRTRREEGKEKLGLKKAWKEAWKTATSGKNKKKYLINGTVNSVLGVALMGFGSHIAGAADTVNVATEALNANTAATTTVATVASTKATVRVAKTTSATGAQLIDAAVSKEKSTAYAAVAGGVINVLMMDLGLNGNSAAAAENANVADVNLAPVATTHAAPVESVDSLASSNVHVDSATVVSDANEPEEVVVETTEAETADLTFPREYSEDMGITQRQYNTLVSTTEGTLKLASGQEVTLDRAYSNLTDEVMETYFPDKTREEVLYSFNRLYGFMRKAYEVGDGTLRETPNGKDYLETKFEAMNLGIDDDKMAELVEFAQENTYADKATLTAGLNEMFPDGLNKNMMNRLVMTIHSNQRFCQNGEEMEALIGLLGCNNSITVEQGRAINALLDRRDEILSTGNGDNRNYMTGLSLRNGCEDDDGQWRTAPVKDAPAPVAEPEPEVEPEQRVVRPDLIPGPKIPQLEVTLSAPEAAQLEPIIVPEEVKPKPMRVRKMITTSFSDFKNGRAYKQETLLPEAAQRMLQIHSSGRNE